MALGRPPKYEATKIAKGVGDYIELCKSNSWLPSVEGLAVQLKVARSTVYKWAEEHEGFSDILEMLLSQQAAQLIQNGLVGTYNSTITKLMLTKHRGADGKPYVDKQDVTSDGKALPIAGVEISVRK